MKHKVAVALAAVVVIAGSLAAFAEKQASGGKVFLPKSGSEIVAELHARRSKVRALEVNQSLEPTGGSRSARFALVSQWRLPPVVHAWCSASPDMPLKAIVAL